MECRGLAEGVAVEGQPAGPGEVRDLRANLDGQELQGGLVDFVSETILA